MRKGRAKLLILHTFHKEEDFAPLKPFFEIHWFYKMSESEQERVLPSIECAYSHAWQRALEPKLAAMKGLRFYQAGNAGVNNIRFDLMPKRVVICSNAGAYSDEVAEFAVALMLAAGKHLVRFDRELRSGTYKHQSPDKAAAELSVYRGATLGIVGYGGIGRSTAQTVGSLGMKVLAFGRHPIKEKGVELLTGRAGLKKLLKNSDAVILAVPLNTETEGMIGKEELALMKPGATLVNIARGEVVQEKALYEHLVHNKEFLYATDVFWPDENGRETFSPKLPFLELPNFFGSPHISGPTALRRDNVLNGVLENLVRYYKGKPLKNIVDRSDYQ